MAQDHGLCRKKKSKSNGPGARAATAGPCCSCQRDSLAACKLLALTLLILAHMEMNRAKHNERGQSKLNGTRTVDEGSGHGRQRRTGTQPAEQALQANTAGGLSVRHRPQNKRPQMAGLAAKTTTAADDVGLPPAVQVSGGNAVVLASRKAGADLPNCPTPPIAFACHCPYPLP